MSELFHTMAKIVGYAPTMFNGIQNFERDTDPELFDAIDNLREAFLVRYESFNAKREFIKYLYEYYSYMYLDSTLSEDVDIPYMKDLEKQREIDFFSSMDVIKLRIESVDEKGLVMTTTFPIPSSSSNASIDKAIELDNWSPLDVHRWSEYPEINNAVDGIYNELTELEGFSGYQGVRKKHVKVILLDLYVKWLTDPDMFTGYYRMKQHYTDLEGRYNKLHISYVTVAIVDGLIELGYVEHVMGHYGREGGSSHMSRMRATTNLVDKYFLPYEFRPEMVEKVPDTECIILRIKDEDNNKIDIPYEDTEETNRMRNDLYCYNNLLRSSFIAIPHFSEECTDTDNNPVRVNFFDKFTRRIFNNASWENGGRFYGGWWQTIPTECRELIRINNIPTVEIDYSGLHIMILYAMKGIDYWEQKNIDPYQLEGYEQTKRMRAFLKDVLLVAINATSQESSKNAIDKKVNFNEDGCGWVKQAKLDTEEILEDFFEFHSEIREYFNSRVGVNLQYYDSLMAEYVINKFTLDYIPILCIHDSFIIPSFMRDKLEDAMQDAYREILIKLGFQPSDTKVKLTLGAYADSVDYGKSVTAFSSMDTGDSTYDELMHRQSFWETGELFDEPDRYYICDW